ncbi:BQ5605_C025g09966 [Microbotryum silenes-dioicae]|uniref:BQ5605_C025g09966 protein n=1 Tax=Microbotryum silenes-dioicae TaxID=796604 RepID=A0A2X0MM60_9BASI|nr:BQ5605_C025g09966 [Microbotryum silenes-dioicae]
MRYTLLLSQAAVYRSIIDDVVEKATVDFDEAGVQIEVLHELQRSWEAKVASSRVADFTQDSRMAAIAQAFPMLPSESSTRAAEPPSTSAPGPVASTSAAAAAGVKGEDDSDEKEKDRSTAVAGNGTCSPAVTPAKPKADADDDAINSDLDDSDEDGDDDDDGAGAGQEGDLVIALYEKVQRVKNKWKVTLKDGLVSVNGKDYLFAKCNG